VPSVTPYHLHFLGGLHVGARGVNLEEARVAVPADTLFSALVSAWRLSGGDPTAFVRPFISQPLDPPLLLTSAFPFAGGVRFYPAPADLIYRFSRKLAEARGKQIKRIAWLSEMLFGKVLAGEYLDDWLFPESVLRNPVNGVALQQGALWLTAKEVADLPSSMRNKSTQSHSRRPLWALRHLSVWRSARVPRVMVGRVSSLSNIFHVGQTRFSKGCGLWFGVEWLHSDASLAGMTLTYRQAFDHALAILKDSGLGGERASGYGAITFQKQGEIEWPDPIPGKSAFLLSR